MKGNTLFIKLDSVIPVQIVLFNDLKPKKKTSKAEKTKIIKYIENNLQKFHESAQCTYLFR